MKKCNIKPIQFARGKRHQVAVDFDGGRLTADAGVLPLREVDRQIGLFDAINKCLPNHRDPRCIVHEQRERDQFSLCCGCEGGSANERAAGTVGKVAVEAAIVTQLGGAKEEDCLGTSGVVPEHLGSLHSQVDLLDQRFHRRAGRRQPEPVVCRVVHP